MKQSCKQLNTTATFLVFADTRSLQFNQCLLQKNNPDRSVFCFLPPSLDTHRFHIILKRV